MLLWMVDGEPVQLLPAGALGLDDVVVLQLREVVFAEVPDTHRGVVALGVLLVKLSLDQLALVAEQIVNDPLVVVEL